MKGDFSRLTFRRDKHYSSVRMQQGRVLLDAEWNEQADIQAQRDQATTRDVIGPSGAPASPLGQFRNFQVRIAGSAFEIADGQLYVDGILCEATEIVPYDAQPDYPGAPALVSGQAYHAYLDVWERHQTALEQSGDDQPQIREVALGGPDTTTRLKTIWQVKAQALANAAATCADFGPDWIPDGVAGAGRLRADAAPAQPAANDCLVPPGGGYRRLENQLYRVEIHRGGGAAEATFKWSRDNGSVVFPLAVPIRQTDTQLSLLHLGRDERFGLRPGDWVELVNDDSSLNERFDASPPPLHQVVAVDPLERTATLAGAVGVNMDLATRPLLRRWDQRAGEDSEGGLTLSAGAAQMGRDSKGNMAWLPLEDGIEVQFSAGEYRTGDYWLIPARRAAGLAGRRRQ